MAPTQTHWLSGEQQAAWRSYIVGTTLLMDTLDRELRQAHGLSLGEYEVLVRLSESPDRTLRMAQIAESVRHSRSRVTHTVTRMEKAGLIARCQAPGDGRGVEAQMTDKGWDLLVKAAPTHVNGVRTHFVEQATEEQFAVLGAVMDAVSDHLLADNEEYADIRTREE
jgi:DNA-binding MarR family transcriptional regulator